MQLAYSPQTLHWTGSAWAECLATTQSLESRRDANGRSTYLNYCDGLMVGSSQRTAVDISGKKMTEVVPAIATGVPNIVVWGGTDVSVSPNDLGAYGAATFPAGSKLHLQTTVITTTSPAVYSTGSRIPRYSAAVAAGGDARKGGAPACSSAEANASPVIPVTSLEELLTYYRGSPCIYNQRSITNGLGETWYGPEVDDDWTNSTLVIGVLGTEPATQTAKSYFTNNTLITASFPSGADRAVNYYSCRQRQLTAMPISTHNCNPIGKGSYDIETLGDARVLRLKSLPSQIAGASVERVYVERAAAVFEGRKTKPALARETQLNLVAANALFSQIGIPAIVP